jgi:hypothetical protein
MIALLENNTEFNYQVWSSDVIINHRDEIIESALQAEKLFENRFGSIKDRDTTWSYQSYNIWLLTSPSPAWYLLFKDLMEVIKNQRDWNTPVWMESWINLHKTESLLDWHTHHWPMHGYISIDPKDTVTEFKEYSIVNNPGQIYIGAGRKLHRVVANGPIDFSSPRITVGFDLAYSFIGEEYPLDYQLMPLIL